jgi:hypothetical protein
MADSQEQIDWDAVRKAANDCLNATWTMVCFAGQSQDDDYDADQAALHLAAIETARHTLRSAREILQPGVPWMDNDSIRYSLVFDAVALATVDRSDRPDFRYGPVCNATAHEVAFELLRWTLFSVENGLAELGDRGLLDHDFTGLDDLLQLAPEILRDTLVLLQKQEPVPRLIDGRDLRQIRAWIGLEWAAVSADPTVDADEETPDPPPPPYLDINLGDREAIRTVDGKTSRISFGNKGKPWELFRELFLAGPKGLSRSQIAERIWPPNGAISDNTLDQHKSKANQLLIQIRLEITPDNRGIWRLVALNS